MCWMKWLFIQKPLQIKICLVLWPKKPKQKIFPPAFGSLLHLVPAALLKCSGGNTPSSSHRGLVGNMQTQEIRKRRSHQHECTRYTTWDKKAKVEEWVYILNSTCRSLYYTGTLLKGYQWVLVVTAAEVLHVCAGRLQSAVRFQASSIGTLCLTLITL